MACVPISYDTCAPSLGFVLVRSYKLLFNNYLCACLRKRRADRPSWTGRKKKCPSWFRSCAGLAQAPFSAVRIPCPVSSRRRNQDAHKRTGRRVSAHLPDLAGYTHQVRIVSRRRVSVPPAYQNESALLCGPGSVSLSCRGPDPMSWILQEEKNRPVLVLVPRRPCASAVFRGPDPVSGILQEEEPGYTQAHRAPCKRLSAGT